MLHAVRVVTAPAADAEESTDLLAKPSPSSNVPVDSVTTNLAAYKLGGNDLLAQAAITSNDIASRNDARVPPCNTVESILESSAEIDIQPIPANDLTLQQCFPDVSTQLGFSRKCLS